jgi:endonuclease YncB( thermonuclease family)
LAFGKVVRVQPTDRDQYGRLVGDVTLPDTRNLGHELVRAGLRVVVIGAAPNDRDLASLEGEGRAARRGL